MEITTISSDSGQLSFTVKGNADYFWPSINQKLIIIMNNLHDYSNNALLIDTRQEAILKNMENISGLLKELQTSRQESIDSLKKLRSKGQKNYNTISSETAKLANKEAWISSIISIIVKSLNVSLFKANSVDSPRESVNADLASGDFSSTSGFPVLELPISFNSEIIRLIHYGHPISTLIPPWNTRYLEMFRCFSPIFCLSFYSLFSPIFPPFAFNPNPQWCRKIASTMHKNIVVYWILHIPFYPSKRGYISL